MLISTTYKGHFYWLVTQYEVNSYCVHRQGKKANKKQKAKKFVGFHNHSHRLTMVWLDIGLEYLSALHKRAKQRVNFAIFKPSSFLLDSIMIIPPEEK